MFLVGAFPFHTVQLQKHIRVISSGCHVSSYLNKIGILVLSCFAIRVFAHFGRDLWCGLHMETEVLLWRYFCAVIYLLAANPPPDGEKPSIRRAGNGGAIMPPHGKRRAYPEFPSLPPWRPSRGTGISPSPRPCHHPRRI